MHKREKKLFIIPFLEHIFYLPYLSFWKSKYVLRNSFFFSSRMSIMENNFALWSTHSRMHFSLTDFQFQNLFYLSMIQILEPDFQKPPRHHNCPKTIQHTSFFYLKPPMKPSQHLHRTSVKLNLCCSNLHDPTCNPHTTMKVAFWNKTQSVNLRFKKMMGCKKKHPNGMSIFCRYVLLHNIITCPLS